MTIKILKKGKKMSFIKSVAIISVAASIAFAAPNTTFNKNVENIIKEKMGTDVKVVSSKEMGGQKGVKFVIIEMKEGQRVPMFTSIDGNVIIGFSNLFLTNDKASEESLKKSMDELQEANNKAKEAGVLKLFKTIPETSVLTLKGGSKKTLMVVTDPECPYCRKELEGIREKLKEATLKLVFAPVHDKSAFIKAQLILDEAKNAKNSEEVIAILNKYFDEKYQLTDEQKKVDPKAIEESAKTIFSSGLIRGVPYIQEIK